MKNVVAYSLSLVLCSHLYGQSLDLKSGWQLNGAIEEINLTDINKSCIDSVWKYNPTQLWQVYLPEVDKYVIPSNVTLFDTLKKGEGFWVNALSNCVIDTNKTRIVTVPEMNLVYTSKKYVGTNYGLADAKYPYLFLADRYNFSHEYHEVKILNIENIDEETSIFILKSISNGSLGNITTDKQKLYFSITNYDGESITYVYDITTITKPIQIAEFSGDLISVRDDIVFLNTGTYSLPELQIVDFSNNTINILSTSNIDISRYNFIVDGNYIYTSVNNAFHIIDISNYAEPKVIGIIEGNYYPSAIIGDIIYAHSHGECITTIDILDKTMPTIINSSLTCKDNNYIATVKNNSDRLYINFGDWINNKYFIRVYDTSNDTFTDIDESIDGCSGMVIDQGHLFSTINEYTPGSDDQNTTVKIFRLD